MKKMLLVFMLLAANKLAAQTGLFRCLPQFTTHPFYYYWDCDMQMSQKTQDGGYVFSFFPWSPNLHSLLPVDFYTIKTDSNFVPQWKKPYYAKAIVLPTGGIILIYNINLLNNLYNGMQIEKVTQSGVQVWIKKYSGENIVLNDGVTYQNKVRFAGRKRGNTGYPWYNETSQAYTMLLDTNGNFISHSLFSSSYTGDADFSRIKRNAQGAFFVYSCDDPMSNSDMVLSKFDSTFNFIWGKKVTDIATPTRICDLDFLPSGNIIASAQISPNYVYQSDALLKFDAQGNIITQKQLVGRSGTSGLCKKNTGNYVLSSAKGPNGYANADSLFLFEIDTSLNVVWNKVSNYGLIAGTPLIKSNRIYTPMMRYENPYITGSDITGNSCMSRTAILTLQNPSITIASFTFSPVFSTAAIVSATPNVLVTQAYSDSCICAPQVQGGYISQNICVGITSTLNVTGTGNLSWYTSANGGTFISGGSSFIYSSAIPTVVTVYAQDSVCQIPNRIAVSVTVNAVPVITVSASNASVCSSKATTTLTVAGANTYTWSTFSNSASVVVTPSITSNYSVTGFVAPGCVDSKTITVTFIQTPTLALNVYNPFLVCIGTPTVISASGAATYSWSNGITTNSLNLLFTQPSYNSYTVIGFNGICSDTAITSALAPVLPTFTATSSATALCAGATATLSTLSGLQNYSYTWSNAVNTRTQIVTPASSTIYTVTGTDISNCSSSRTIAVTIYTNPIVGIISPGPSVCYGASVVLTATGSANSYTWANSVISPTITIVPLTNTIYTVTGSNVNNCPGTATIGISVFPSPSVSVITSSSIVCAGSAVSFTAMGAISYTWNTGATTNTTIANPTTNGNYTVLGSNSNNCTSAGTVFIFVNPLPVINITVTDSIICYGETVTLTASGGNTYSWSIPANGNVAIFSPTATGLYNVNGSDQRGCQGFGTGTIIVNPLPIINISGGDSPICAGESTTLTASGASSYSWSSFSNNSSLVISPATTSIYIVTGTDLNGCINSASHTQSVDLCTGILKRNNEDVSVSIFPTPNNGIFSLRCSNCGYTGIEIYNSLGQFILRRELLSENTQFDLANEAPGVYFLSLSVGGKQGNFKIIKQ